MADQNVVRRADAHRTGGFADRDGDFLAIGQVHGDGRTGHWSANGGGVGDVAAFGSRRRGLERDGGVVDGVCYIGHRWRGVRHQLLEVAAFGLGDGGLDLAGVFVHVIARCRDGHGASGFTGLDMDHGTVAQRHGDRSAGRVGQGRGVGDLATLSHGTGGTEAEIGGVDGVGDRGLGRFVADSQFFVVAAIGPGNGGAQGTATGQSIVRRREIDRSLAFTDWDGDGLAVGQGHHHWRAGHRRGHRRGVNHGSTFGHAWRGAQAHRRRIDSVGNVSNGWRRVGYQVLEIAAVSFGDGGFDLAGVLINIIGRGGDSRGAGSGACGDGDHCAIAQRHGDRSTGRIAQCCGVDNGSAFSHGIGGREAQRRGVWGVGHAGFSRFVADIQLLVIATVGLGDGGAQGATASQGIVGRGEIDRTLAFAHRNGDGLAVGQGDHDRRASHWRGDRCGVHHDAAFGDTWRSSQ